MFLEFGIDLSLFVFVTFQVYRLSTVPVTHIFSRYSPLRTPFLPRQVYVYVRSLRFIFANIFPKKTRERRLFLRL